VALVGLFAWFSHRWLSHQWEFEADLYSAGPEPNPVDPVKSEVVQPAANSFRAMRFALLRLSAYAGDDWKKSTLFHPSLRQRIEFLDAIERNPQAAVDFKRKSRWRRNSLVLAWLLLAAAAAIPVGLL
jgi:Zn-dependent protease with chaperone function